MAVETRRFDVAAIRDRFPALARSLHGRPAVLLDGPAGTQVPRECIDAISDYLERGAANSHGRFETSRETDGIAATAHEATADFLGARSGDEVVFGPNMTTLTFAFSRAIGRLLEPGDEIIVSRLDHDANIAPWLALEQERGARVRWIDIVPDDCTLDLSSLGAALSPRTRLVAVGLASNAVGTVNPVAAIADLAHQVGAWVWVDAVHAGPHLPIDVEALGCDFLACSAYKFFAPHLGMVWGRREILEQVPPVKLRPSPDELPTRFETGTPAFELQAGLLGTYRYLEWVGVSQGGATGEPGAADGGRRSRLRRAMETIRGYERDLSPRLVDGLRAIPGVTFYGITDATRADERVPTVSFRLQHRSPAEVADALGRQGIAVWDGNYYAWELERVLGLQDLGGMVRVGLVHYNTADEIDRLLDAVEHLAHR